MEWSESKCNTYAEDVAVEDGKTALIWLVHQESGKKRIVIDMHVCFRSNWLKISGKNKSTYQKPIAESRHCFKNVLTWRPNRSVLCNAILPYISIIFQYLLF